VVVRAHLEYKYPAAADDQLLVRGWISHHTKTSFTLQYEITNQDSGKLILTAETFHVFVDDNNRPVRIPEEFKNKFL
jgi:YbgC/YbaW family acyl-CoA thioester hydrolase